MIDEKTLIEALKQRIALHEKDGNDFANEHIHYDAEELFLRLADEVQAIIEVIEEQPKVNEWISCSERMPEEMQHDLYWTTHEDGSVVLHGYTEKNGFIYNWETEKEKRKRQGSVIAWKPYTRPEPYKEGLK